MDKPGLDSDRLWQAVIEASPAAMIALDGDSNVRLWNLLQHGRILLDGPKREVLTSQHLTTLFGAPVQVQEGKGYYTAASAE